MSSVRSIESVVQILLQESAGTKRLEDSERAQIHRLFYCPSLDSMYLFHSIFISNYYLLFLNAFSK